MFRNILSKSIQTFNDFMKHTICFQHTGNSNSIIEDRKVDLPKQDNSHVKQFSLFLSRELSETRSRDNVSSREAIGMLLKRWNNMKDNEKRFYSVVGNEEIGNIKSRKSIFPKTTRMIDVKNTDPYSMVTQQTTQSLDRSYDVTEKRKSQRLTYLNGFSVFMHHNFSIVIKKQPHLSPRKVFCKVATLWRNSTPEIRKLYKQHAKRIRGRYCYSISGVVNFGELFEEVLATSKTSGNILTEKYESDDRDFGRLELVI